MLKKGDVIIIDDEVRASASQKRATGTLCTEEFFLRTQYIHCTALPSYQQRGVGRQQIDGQRATNGQSQLGFSL
jgi:hypothetical protein